MKTACGACGKPLESFETIHLTGEGPRCYPCFNRETAERLGIDFDEPQFQPIVLEDVDGTHHTFTIRSMLVPTGLEMEAIERLDDGRAGYRFAVRAEFRSGHLRTVPAAPKARLPKDMRPGKRTSVKPNSSATPGSS